VSTPQGKQANQGRIQQIGDAVYRVRRRIATGLAVVLAVFLAYHVVFGSNGVNSYEQKRVQDGQLQKQIESLQQENGRLKDHVKRLKSDPDAIEYEAREKLHYARPGEVIYTLNDQPHAGAQSANGGSN
jgi:cell division protein FtsB